MKQNQRLAIYANHSTLSCSVSTADIMVLPSWLKNSKPKRTVTPRYTNQLDLFSEGTKDTLAPVDNTPRSSGVNHGRPRSPQQLDFGALEPLPAFDAGQVAMGRMPGAGTGEDGAGVRGSPVRTDIGKENGTPPGLGTGGEPVPAGRVILDDQAKPSRDFRITGAHGIGLVVSTRKPATISRLSAC